MKKFVFLLLVGFSFHHTFGAEEINWLDFESAVEANKKDKKPFFIDVYTDWCGWCKKMDQSTFIDPQVVTFINENFHAVKFNAEQQEAIVYKDYLYESKKYGSKMYNELAYNLCSGSMSFPSFVVLNKKEVRKTIIRGYKSAPELLALLENYK